MGGTKVCGDGKTEHSEVSSLFLFLMINQVKMHLCLQLFQSESLIFLTLPGRALLSNPNGSCGYLDESILDHLPSIKKEQPFLAALLLFMNLRLVNYTMPMVKWSTVRGST